MARNYECVGTEMCCFIRGERCQYSVEDQGGRRYACSLMLKYQSWDEVVASPEYVSVGKEWEAHPADHVKWDYCQTFDPAFCCRPEYRQGRSNELESVVID